MLIVDTLHALCANRRPIVDYAVDGVDVRYRVWRAASGATAAGKR